MYATIDFGPAARDATPISPRAPREASINLASPGLTQTTLRLDTGEKVAVMARRRVATALNQMPRVEVLDYLGKATHGARRIGAVSAAVILSCDLDLAPAHLVAALRRADVEKALEIVPTSAEIGFNIGRTLRTGPLLLVQHFEPAPGASASDSALLLDHVFGQFRAQHPRGVMAYRLRTFAHHDARLVAQALSRVKAAAFRRAGSRDWYLAVPLHHTERSHYEARA